MFKNIMIYHPRVLSDCQYNDKYKNYQVTRESVLELYSMSKVGNIQIICFV